MCRSQSKFLRVLSSIIMLVVVKQKLIETCFLTSVFIYHTSVALGGSTEQFTHHQCCSGSGFLESDPAGLWEFLDPEPDNIQGWISVLLKPDPVPDYPKLFENVPYVQLRFSFSWGFFFRNSIQDAEWVSVSFSVKFIWEQL